MELGSQGDRLDAALRAKPRQPIFAALRGLYPLLVSALAAALAGCGSGDERAEAPAEPPAPAVEFAVEDLVIGDGAECAAPDAVVTIHYRGMLLDGSEFDSSYERGAPIVAPLDSLIPGWQRGLPGMQVGGKRRLTVPADLAYSGMVALQAVNADATGGAGELLIPPDSTLIFEIELLDVGSSASPDREAELARTAGD